MQHEPHKRTRTQAITRGSGSSRSESDGKTVSTSESETWTTHEAGEEMTSPLERAEKALENAKSSSDPATGQYLATLAVAEMMFEVYLKMRRIEDLLESRLGK